MAILGRTGQAGPYGVSESPSLVVRRFAKTQRAIVIPTPRVSIVVPCRNEGPFIGRCLKSIALSDYPKTDLEVIVVDGMSKDGTRGIIDEYTRRYDWVRRIDNPKSIIPAAMNLGIDIARGAVIMKMDAHSTYDPRYITICMRYLDTHQADGVGGVLRIVPRRPSLVGRSIAASLSHVFGAGTSYFKTGVPRPRFVDAVGFGCYRREIFDEIGLYNEDLVRSSDADLNVRLRRAGHRLLLVPEAVAYYHAESNLVRYWRRNYADGLWVTYPLKFGSRVFSLRHLVPMVFVSTLIGVSGLILVSPLFLWVLGGISGAYLIANAIASVQVARTEHHPGLLLATPVAFFVRHVAHGLGCLVGLIRAYGERTNRLSRSPLATRTVVNRAGSKRVS